MVKAILFDFWGTLVENGVRSPVKQVRHILDIRLPFPEYVVRMERAMMTGKFTALKDAFENVCQEFNLECNEEILEKLVGMWNKSWMLAHPYEEVVEELEKLKKEYQLILISNTDNFSVNNVLEKYDLAKFFDKIFFSYEVQMIKTDKNFLKLVLDEIKLDLNDCVVVGDSIQSDIIPAKRIGMKAVLMDRRNTRDYQPKVLNLKELKEVI